MGAVILKGPFCQFRDQKPAVVIKLLELGGIILEKDKKQGDRQECLDGGDRQKVCQKTAYRPAPPY